MFACELYRVGEFKGEKNILDDRLKYNFLFCVVEWYRSKLVNLFGLCWFVIFKGGFRFFLVFLKEYFAAVKKDWLQRDITTWLRKTARIRAKDNHSSTGICVLYCTYFCHHASTGADACLSSGVEDVALCSYKLSKWHYVVPMFLSFILAPWTVSTSCRLRIFRWHESFCMKLKMILKCTEIHLREFYVTKHIQSGISKERIPDNFKDLIKESIKIKFKFFSHYCFE